MLHNEARELLIKAYKKNPNARMVAEMFSVSPSTVYRMVEQERETGSVRLRVNQRGRKPILSKEDIANIQAQIESRNDITIDEIREVLHLSASRPTVERAVLKLGYTVKKKSLYASERDRLRCNGKTHGVERLCAKN